MTWFIIRIELHHETNYEPLHRQMASRGFKRRVTGDDGTQYKLQTGTYYYEGNVSPQFVRDLAAAAASAIGHHRPAILVAQTPSMSWTGLEVVSAYELLYAVGM